MSFFSFLDNTSQQDTSVAAIDDFISAHVQTAETAPSDATPVSAAGGAATIAEPRQELYSGNAESAHAKLKQPILAELEGQIHPLMRNQRLDTPEDIAAWIAERKSKYPTDANIRLKSGQQQQQHAAQSEIKRKQHPPKGSDVSKKNRIDPGPSGNPLSMLAGYGSGLSDSDNELSSSSDSSKDSGSESESDSAPEVVSAKHQAPNMPFKPSGIAPGADRRKLRVCKYFAMGKCRKGNACPFAHPESIKERLEQEAAAAAAESKARASNSNLLGMLLAKDIERENYRVLQCIEYICDRGFFNLPVEYSLLFKK